MRGLEQSPVLSLVNRAIVCRIRATVRSQKMLWVSGLSVVSLLSMSPRVRSAERIEFVLDPVGQLPITVTVKDLRLFAETGTASGAVQLYTKLAPKQQEEDLQAVLLQSYRISPTTIEQFTATQLGEQMLRQVSSVIRLHDSQTNEAVDSSVAFKSALLESAKNPQGFTLLNFLEGFPDPVLRIDLNQSVVIVRELFRVFQQQQTLTTALTQQAAGHSTTATSLPPWAEAWQSLGPYQWKTETLSVENPDRQRSLSVDLFRPLQPQRLIKSVPLVIISHGLASNRDTFGYLARHLASHGYAVAVLEHPGSNSTEIQRFFSGLDNLEGETDWINRPGDVRYVLDQLTLDAKAERSQRNRVAQPIPLNLKQVGIVGQSFGGYTSMALAGATLNLDTLRQACPQPNTKQLSLNIALLFQCEAAALPESHYQLHDPRIKVAIAINTIGSSIFSPAGMQQVKIPILMVSGTDDVIAPTVAEQLIPFSWLTTPHKYLLLVERATHFSFLEGDPEEQVVRIPSELQGPNPTLAQPLLKGMSTAFFNRYLRQDDQADALLNSAYAQQLSLSPFSAYLLQDLTVEEGQLKVQPGIPSPTPPASAVAE